MENRKDKNIMTEVVMIGAVKGYWKVLGKGVMNQEQSKETN